MFRGIWLSSGKTLALAGVFLLGIALTAMDAKTARSKNSVERIAPPPSLERFSFGFHEVVADGLWLRSIQDFDFCEQRISEMKCKGEGWLFQMLDTVTNLSPKFRMPLATGPIALAILAGDSAGASRLYDKAVKTFPKDPSILHRAVYQALYEEKNYAKAAELAKRAADNGAPQWLYSLSVHMYNKSGQQMIAQGLLNDLEQSGVSEEILERVRLNIARKTSELPQNPKVKKNKEAF